jgi:hypothetical protein
MSLLFGSAAAERTRLALNLQTQLTCTPVCDSRRSSQMPAGTALSMQRTHIPCR